MEKIAQELLKVAKELTAAGARVKWGTSEAGDDMLLYVDVSFMDLTAWGDEVGYVLDDVLKKANKKLKAMEWGDYVGIDIAEVKTGWSTVGNALRMVWYLEDGGGVWARDVSKQWR